MTFNPQTRLLKLFYNLMHDREQFRPGQHNANRDQAFLKTTAEDIAARRVCVVQANFYLTMTDPDEERAHDLSCWFARALSIALDGAFEEKPLNHEGVFFAGWEYDVTVGPL